MLHLKEIRLAQGLSVPALSRLSSVPVRTIEDIERRGDCRVSTLFQLAQALGVTLNDLYSPEKTEE